MCKWTRNKWMHCSFHQTHLFFSIFSWNAPLSWSWKSLPLYRKSWMSQIKKKKKEKSLTAVVFLFPEYSSPFSRDHSSYLASHLYFWPCTHMNLYWYFYFLNKENVGMWVCMCKNFSDRKRKESFIKFCFDLSVADDTLWSCDPGRKTELKILDWITYYPVSTNLSRAVHKIMKKKICQLITMHIVFLHIQCHSLIFDST